MPRSPCAAAGVKRRHTYAHTYAHTHTSLHTHLELGEGGQGCQGARVQPQVWQPTVISTHTTSCGGHIPQAHGQRRERGEGRQLLDVCVCVCVCACVCACVCVCVRNYSGV